MIKIHFPHIHRKLTAVIGITLFLLFSLLNLMQNQLFGTNEERELRFSLLQKPDISNIHEKLGQLYLEVNEKWAKREYQLAQEYYNELEPTASTKVLGSEVNPWQKWQNYISKKQNQENEIKYWKSVQKTYPDYLYADLKLAVLSMQQGEATKIKTYLAAVILKDPTNQIALRLTEKLK